VPRMLSRVALLVVAGLLVAALAVPAFAASPKRKYTPAGNAVAKSVLLKLSDLPTGWKASNGGGGNAHTTCPSFDPDQSDLTSIGKADSGFESKDGLSSISSIAGVFKNTGQAQTSWNRVVRPGMLTCLASILESSGTKAAPIKVTSKGKLGLTVPGHRAAAYRLVADVTSKGQHLNVYLDLIMQGGGQADTVLLVTSVLTAPSPVFESKLASAVAGRLPKR